MEQRTAAGCEATAGRSAATSEEAEGYRTAQAPADGSEAGGGDSNIFY